MTASQRASEGKVCRRALGQSNHGWMTRQTQEHSAEGHPGSGWAVSLAMQAHEQWRPQDADKDPALGSVALVCCYRLGRRAYAKLEIGQTAGGPVDGARLGRTPAPSAATRNQVPAEACTANATRATMAFESAGGGVLRGPRRTGRPSGAPSGPGRERFRVPQPRPSRPLRRSWLRRLLETSP